MTTWYGIKRLIYKLYEGNTKKGFIIRVLMDLLVANISLLAGYFVAGYYYLFIAGHQSLEEVKEYFFINLPQDILIFSLALPMSFLAVGLYRRSSGTRMIHRLIHTTAGLMLTFFTYFFVHMFISYRLPKAITVSAFLLVGVSIVSLRVIRAHLLKKYTLKQRFGAVEGAINRVLVIGGAGYIGSVMVRELLKKNYNVRIIDTFMFGENSIADLKKRSDFEIFRGDFRNVEDMVRSLRGVDAIIHLGAIVGDPACALDKDLTYQINTNAVKMIREACRGYGIRRMVFASTCSVYGASEGIIDENSALNPVSDYARSKIEAEKAILEHVTADFKPTILRLGTAFGLSYRMRFDLVVNLLTAKAFRDGEISIFNGHQWRPFVHIKDISRAFIATLEAEENVVGGQIFNVGDNSFNRKIHELGDSIQQFVPRAQITRKIVDEDQRSYNVDFSKIRNAIGFHNTITLEEGVEEILEALKADKIRDYSNAIYSNATFMKNNLRMIN